MDGYLAKPISTQRLLEALAKIGLAQPALPPDEDVRHPAGQLPVGRA